MHERSFTKEAMNYIGKIVDPFDLGYFLLIDWIFNIEFTFKCNAEMLQIENEDFYDDIVDPEFYLRVFLKTIMYLQKVFFSNFLIFLSRRLTC